MEEDSNWKQNKVDVPGIEVGHAQNEAALAVRLCLLRMVLWVGLMYVVLAQHP